MRKEDLDEFFELRRFVFGKIESALVIDGNCKSYEGRFSIVFPNYLDEPDDGEKWGVTLDCYVFGPSRHYQWWGKSLRDALDKANREIRGWDS